MFAFSGCENWRKIYKLHRCAYGALELRAIGRSVASYPSALFVGPGMGCQAWSAQRLEQVWLSARTMVSKRSACRTSAFDAIMSAL